MSLGINIKTTRIQKKLSQGVLANRLKISQNYLCLIEKDHQKPSLDLLERIAQRLNTTVSDLTKLDAKEGVK